MTDESFSEIYNFMKSIMNVSAEMRISIMNTHPNKTAYKWIKKYDLLTIDTSNILVYKQAAGAALDKCQKVAKYCILFNDVWEINEVQAGNNHPTAKTLYKRVCVKYGNDIP
jgi:hypothetical protein